MYIYVSIADACQRNSLMQANLHHFSLSIYICIYQLYACTMAREARAMQCAYWKAVQPKTHTYIYIYVTVLYVAFRAPIVLLRA